MIEILVAALFLPLFPLSMLLNGLLSRLKSPLARFLITLLWPQIGIFLLHAAKQPVPEGFVTWSLASSGFYALRLLTVRDLGLWAGFLASSAVALVWISSESDRHLLAFWLSLPSALLFLLSGAIEKRCGAAYAGLSGGLATRFPRLSGLLILTLLAAVATPPFPGFFEMLGLLQGANIAPAILFIWLLWGWAGIKLAQGFQSGSDESGPVNDIGKGATLMFACLLGTVVVASLYLKGGAL